MCVRTTKKKKRETEDINLKEEKTWEEILEIAWGGKERENI